MTRKLLKTPYMMPKCSLKWRMLLKGKSYVITSEVNGYTFMGSNSANFYAIKLAELLPLKV